MHHACPPNISQAEPQPHQCMAFDPPEFKDKASWCSLCRCHRNTCVLPAHEQAWLATCGWGHLVAVVARFHDGPSRDVRYAARRAVDAHRPVRVIALLDVQHAQKLAVLLAALNVPWSGVAAAVDCVVQDVEPWAKRTPRVEIASPHKSSALETTLSMDGKYSCAASKKRAPSSALAVCVCFRHHVTCLAAAFACVSRYKHVRADVHMAAARACTVTTAHATCV